MPKRLFLVDAMAQIYRAFFAMSKRPLYTSKGENVSAVFGFANMMLALLTREKPDRLAIIYDSREPTFRHHIYKEYKATRDKMPEELVEQLPRLDEILEVLNLPKLILPGYEADDLAGTVSKRGAQRGYEVYLVTGDKDFFQLVGDHVFVYNPKQGLDDVLLFDRKGVEETFGVPPEKVVDVLALAGDTSDNIPGVPKIGIKTALRLVKQYGSVEEVLNRWEEVGGKIGENLRDYREQALLSKNLVTIRTEAPIEVDPDALEYGPWNTERARDLFAELEFKSLFRYLEVEPQRVEEQAGGVEYRAVTDEKGLAALLRELKSAERFALDTETTSTDPVRATLVGLSVSARHGAACYVPVNYFRFKDDSDPGAFGYPIAECGERARRLLDRLRPVLEGGPGKVGQNAKYDFLVLRRHGIEAGPLVFDTMLADYLLNPASRSHNLDALALNYLQVRKVPTRDLIGSGRKQVTMDTVPLEQITHYACEDADVTLRLLEVLEPKINAAGLGDLLREVELPLSHVLEVMEGHGIRLDVDFLRTMSEEMRKRMAALEAECHLLAGVEFNLNSPKQLAHILFEKLNLPTRASRKTKTGYSTDQDVLEKLAPLDPLPKKILEYRQMQKLVGTYIDALPELVNPETGRLHTSYNQAVAATGRLSSTDPNLQNIPIRTEQGAEIRKAFIAAEGCKLLSADYSQIELRMMAHLSGDEGLIEAFEHGEDIHLSTASKIFGVPLGEVTREQRSASKAVNFGVLFGMSEFGLASRLGISRNKAREFIEGYFGAYPRAKRFIEELIEQARAEGYVQTMLGRRRPVPELNASNRNVRQAAERVTIATAVQGSAADLIKVAMIRLQREIEREKLPYKMLLQVHDELVFEVPEERVEEAAGWAKASMESAMTLRVPVVADTGWGDNWLEAH